MKKSIKDYNLEDKKVIIRCDFNVPIVDGKITDYSRIDLSIPTIDYAVKNGAKVILMSHLSRVKSEEDKLKKSLKIIVPRLEEKLNMKIKFSPLTRGAFLEEQISGLEKGEVLLIENTRHEDFPEKLESGNDLELSKYWASLADLFINNAYGSCHRAHASTVGVASLIDNGVGFLVEQEITALQKFVDSPEKPLCLIMGGAKISSKISLIDSLIDKVDYILLAGGMAFPFLKAKGFKIGKSLCEEDKIDYCKEILAKYDSKIILPSDVVDQDQEIIEITDFSDETIGYDVGPKTIKAFSGILKDSKRVIWNGPLGMYEDKRYKKGTEELSKLLSELDALVLVGGGDSAAAVKETGLEDKFYHISTGGGATLEFLEGKVLPGINIITEK